MHVCHPEPRDVLLLPLYEDDLFGTAATQQFEDNYSNVGSSNGLVCIQIFDANTRHYCTLSNPFIGRLKKIPKQQPSDQTNEPASMHYGLGYDSALVDERFQVYIDRTNIYNLKSESWKRIVQSMPLNDCFALKSSNALLFDSALHWQMGNVYDHDPCMVLSLHLVTEKYRVFPIQFGGAKDFYSLCSLGGFLCILNLWSCHIKPY